jgi:hydrogenase expression/formation protein HypE
MSHGGGGRAMAQLIDELFQQAFDNPWLRQANDQALLARPEGRIVMATDSHVVSPLFFPGGDIGSLSVHGTINDVATSGAKPLWLSAGFILEEGFPLADLKRIVDSMAAASRAAGVPIVTGDTKVVERGKGDGVFINTTGVGVVPDGIEISGDRARPGDRILVSGFLGDHGVAIMSLRENLSFSTTIVSDSAALHELIAAMVEAAPDIHCLRDPTRGGLAATLNEIARQSGVGMASARTTSRCARRSTPPANCWASTRSTSRTRARWSRSARRSRPSPAGGDARASRWAGRRDHRRGDRGQPRLRADGDQLRRPPQRRLDLRRAASAHLLTAFPVTRLTAIPLRESPDVLTAPAEATILIAIMRE